MTGSSLLIAGFAVFFGVQYWRQMARLRDELFGSGGRLRFVNRRWAVEGTSPEGRTVRYTTGGSRFITGTSYLFVSATVGTTAAVEKEGMPPELPAAVLAEIETLRRRDGFVRLNISDSGRGYNLCARVNWGNPGPGLMLRRYTRQGCDTTFVRADLASLEKIVDGLSSFPG